MRRHRKLLIFLLVLVVAAAAGVVVYERVARPARAALLLPEGNFLLYVNFTPVHFIDLGQMPAQSDPQYQDFLRQTDFHFEHDLDTIAISQRNPGDMNSESSAIFTGNFNQGRLNGYLERLANGKESYADRTIYLIQQEGHTVRACIVDAKTVAVTNMDSAEPMHSIIDKSRGVTSASPALVKDYYHYVPFGSLAWAMFRVSSEPRASQLPGGINVDFLQNTVSIISVRYTGSIRVRAEVVSANEAEASRVLQAANTFLLLAKGAGETFSPGGTHKDVKAVFDNIQVQQTGNRTVISVTIPQAFVQKMAARMNQ
jgi:hypothetical protein